MFTVPKSTLRFLAAFVWHLGGFVLVLKGRHLLQEALAIKPVLIWPVVAIAIALILGGLKAKYLFIKSCQKNLARIATLHQPRVWQFFQPGFFLALAAMIFVGSTLSRLAQENYHGLIGVALLDLTVAVALWGSGFVFWQQARPSHQASDSI